MRIKKELVPQKLSQLANLDAEFSLLGCLLIDSGDCEATEEVCSSLTVTDFYFDTNKKIFQIIKRLFDKGTKIDIVTVMETAQRQGEGQELVDQLLSLANIVPSVANYQYYLKIVKDYANLRKTENICHLGAELVKSGKNADSVISVMQDELNKITEGSLVAECESIADAAENTFERIKKRANGQYDEFGLETGFKCLDRCLWGLQKSDLVIVAARAGVGKTAFALNVISHAGLEDKKKVAFFSLEMPKNQIAERLFSINTEISNSDLKAGRVANKFKAVEQVKKSLQDSKIFIDDQSNNTVQSMLLKAKRLKRKEGLDLVVIDYLQFVKPQEKSGNRFQDVGEIARGLKSMARELNVPVIALCQLNRQLDNEDREPTLADLRESGEIENNADIVMFLNRKSGRAEEVKDIDLIIGKFRNGALRTIRMTYKGDCFKFAEKEKAPKQKVEQIELEPIEDDGLPF